MSTLDANGIVWALSGVSIMVLVVSVYFAIFWAFMYMTFWGIAEVWRAVYKLMNI